jgi:hypothetical protein
MVIFSNQKSPFWVNYGGPCNGKGWFILWPLGFLREILHF